MVPRSMMSEGEDEAQLHRLHQRLAAGEQLGFALHGSAAAASTLDGRW